MIRSRQPGKKIGTLKVKLDRMKTRYQRATVEVELRFDITNGVFWARYEGNWLTAKTKDELSELVKAAATKTLSVEWKRYIQIDYQAQGWPIADTKTGRPATDGRYHTYEIDDNRKKFDDKDDHHAICSIDLHWTVCEISEPYALPEEPSKRVRARRAVNVERWGPDKGEEKIGDPEEWEDDVLPPGTLLWTPDREALLVEVVAALGRLDARLVDLFAGDAKQLAEKIDSAQIDPSRLLAASAEPNAETPPKRRRV